MTDTLPDWYTPEEQQAAVVPPNPAGPAQPAAAMPSWYAPEQVTVSADKPDNPVGDFIGNTATGVARVPGAIIGTPHTLAHAANWIWAQLGNAWNGVKPDGTWRQGADYDESNPLTKHTLSSEDVDNGVFRGLSAVSHAAGGGDVKPYDPHSFIGKLYQAAVTGGGAGLVDPMALSGVFKASAPLTSMAEGAIPRMAKTAFAAGAANATDQALPGSPLAPLAAIAAHGSASTAADLGVRGYRNFVEPIVRPRVAAEVNLGGSLANADHTQPGLADPSRKLIDNTTDATRKAVDDIGDGQNDYEAGGNIRDDLQARKDKLIADRQTASEASRAAFNAEAPMSVQKLDGFLQRPGFRRALIDAGKSVKDEGNSPTVRYWDVEGAGAPASNPDGVPGVRMRVQALPPEVLDRIKGHLDDAVNEAQPGSRAQRTAKILRDQYKGLLDEQYPNTYPKAREDYATNSRPLDPLERGKVGQALDSETKFGTRTYSQSQERIAEGFLGSKALKTDYDNLVAAYGGDKNAALGNLEENLAHKVQGAINGDGTLSLDAFNRSVRPYTKALSMYFPQLAQKFSTAEASQRSLETLVGQRELASGLAQGEAVGSSGFTTGSSLSRWIARNEKQLENTQSKGAVMRLRQIAKALPEDPAGGAEAAVEAAPMLVGAAAGGLEGGVLGGITHNIPGYLAKPRFASYRAAYNNAVEQAIKDPIAAQKLVALAAKRGGKEPMRQVLKENALAALRAAPAATNAGTLPGD